MQHTQTPTSKDFSPAAAIMQFLEDNWYDLAIGRCTGEQLVYPKPDLWYRFMTEWPLGSYALATAKYLERHRLLKGNVLELGAGVGATSSLVASKIEGEYTRTDVLGDLLLSFPLPERRKVMTSIDQVIGMTWT